MILSLAVSGEYIAKGQNVLITDATGVGKSFLAQALAKQAIFEGYTGRYYRVTRLFEVVEERTLSGSTIITIQLPVKEWHNYLGSTTIADAMIDRLIYSAHRIEMKGEFMRKVVSEK